MANLEYLSSVADPYTGVTLYNFSQATDIDRSFKRPSASVAVPGGYYDPNGVHANPYAPVTLPYKWWHTYKTTAPYSLNNPEKYDQAKSELLRAIGWRELVFFMAYPDGTFRRNTGKLISFNDPIKKENALQRVQFDVVFSLDSPYWKAVTSMQKYDTGIQYDTGQGYDAGPSITLGAASQTITLSNSGDAPEYEARFTIYAPFDCPIAFLNTTYNIPGSLATAPYRMDYTGPSLQILNGVPESLVIDNGNGSVLRNGVPDFGNFSYGGGYAQRDIFPIFPGTNVIQCSHPAVSTTLGANVSIGATTIIVNSYANIIPGTILVIGTGAGSEGAQVVTVNQSTIGLLTTLTKNHSNGDAVTNLAGGTLLTEVYDTWQ